MLILRCVALPAGMCIASVSLAQEVSAAARSELTLGDSVRVGLNLTNTATVTKDAKTLGITIVKKDSAATPGSSEFLINAGTERGPGAAERRAEI